MESENQVFLCFMKIQGWAEIQRYNTGYRKYLFLITFLYFKQPIFFSSFVIIYKRMHWSCLLWNTYCGWTKRWTDGQRDARWVEWLWNRRVEYWARSLAPLTHSLAPHCSLRSRASPRSFVRSHRSLTRSRAHGKEVYVFEMNASIS